MKYLIFLLILFSCSNTAINEIDHQKIEEDLNEIISDLSQHYIYLEEKNIDLDCIKSQYQKQISNLKTKEEIILFFEYLLNEFYDSHLILNTNVKASYRLFSPIYASFVNEKAYITNIWKSQIKTIQPNLIGAEIIKINAIPIAQAIQEFPTYCNDKNDPKVKTWILNKLLAGRYNAPRILSLKLVNNSTLKFDLDQIEFKKNVPLLNTHIQNEIAIIRINNSLGNNQLINDFDQTLDTLFQTKGLILDLRNTVDGGNSYVARGIMGRFIDTSLPYQKHFTREQYDGNPVVERNWTEYVSPRKKTYTKPLVILVGRWTGSMGEGLAIGFDGMKRASIVGTEMERLAGEMNGFSFIHQNFGYRLSTAKLFHTNGTLREEYVPSIYINQTNTDKDEALERATEILNQIINE